MYGILISLAILISASIAEKLAKSKDKDTEVVWRTLTWGITFGVIGARIYHVLDFWDFYIQRPNQIFEIWKGGLGIYGAVFGGMVGIVLYLKRANQPILEWLDIAGTVMPLGQAIGRWGNFFNRELYGINKAPLFLYESTLNLFLFFVLFRKIKETSTPGRIFYMYLLGYGLIRFFLDFLRVNPWKIYGLNVSQTISLILIIVSTLFLTQKSKKPR